MLTLALDTSTSQGGVAVLRDDITLATRIWNRTGSHGEHLTSSIEDALQEAKCLARDIDTLAVGHGPGSFTGIRIAVNAARALAYANSARVFAFSTNEILVHAVPGNELPVLVLVNAQKNLVFAASYRFDPSRRQWLEVPGQTIGLQPIDLNSLDARILTPHVCVGDGFLEYTSVFSPTLGSRLVRKAELSDFPSPDVIGRMAWESKNTHPALDWKDLQALYIRASGAEEKREGGK